MRSSTFLLILFLIAAPVFAAKKNLEIYFIDVEGGQSTLFVSPSGESLLIDTGWPGFSARDAKRIITAAKSAGVKKIDHVIITHHHADHVGGALQLVERIPVGTFYDKGPNIETGTRAKELNEMYEKAFAQTKHVVVKAGDRIPVKGLDVKVVAANGQFGEPVSTKPNPLCSGVARKDNDPTENALSVGVRITLGKFRIVDMGDLTWNKELDAVCPADRIGPADVYITTHHGLDSSNPPPMVQTVAAKVTIMNNGARKGGSPGAFGPLTSVPESDLWQLHYSIAGGEKNNTSETHIANLVEACDGKHLHLTAMPDGSFTVVNSRNKFSRTYRP